MTRLLIILVPLVLMFWVFSVIDCAAQPSIRHRGVSKPVWILIVILIPVLGGILWFWVGRVRARDVAITIPDSPDDDPAFLRSVSPLSAQDERIRQLEEELARLDAEDDLPPQSKGDKARGDKPPKPDKARPDSDRPGKPRRNADGAPTPSSSTDDTSSRDGDGDGLGRHGANG
ncbi:PLD nuclease N-terminal domain-containing protein [Microbacterium rhizosphaerae]|uniref:PLD nuclease N-terminal domain-containing protein n=1 Tax=Microbacterium rhizosphaerae TaxID=1678237 RepID=A0ABZ0SJB6_9MICO|nr:PLD nuclease N-terminal domain-containing protein [Microbacterium rhizosphaerae]WPR89183.1 PLD nuclease N-terminal domain-containing protein [Microbacterium rhizosphaerae]